MEMRTGYDCRGEMIGEHMRLTKMGPSQRGDFLFGTVAEVKWPPDSWLVDVLTIR